MARTYCDVQPLVNQHAVVPSAPKWCPFKGKLPRHMQSRRTAKITMCKTLILRYWRMCSLCVHPVLIFSSIAFGPQKEKKIYHWCTNYVPAFKWWSCVNCTCFISCFETACDIWTSPLIPKKLDMQCKSKWMKNFTSRVTNDGRTQEPTVCSLSILSVYEIYDMAWYVFKQLQSPWSSGFCRWSILVNSTWQFLTPGEKNRVLQVFCFFLAQYTSMCKDVILM